MQSITFSSEKIVENYSKYYVIDLFCSAASSMELS